MLETRSETLSPHRLGPAGADTQPRLLAVVNGNASAAGDPERLAALVSALLSEAGARAEARVTRSERELREALEDSGGRRVALVGGDGTLHAAVNLPLALPQLALIPSGRANNVARALGIPEGLADAARVAVAAPAGPVDVLRVESGSTTMYSIEALSAGLQAEARSTYNGHNSGDLRAGALALLGAIRGYRPYEVELRTDGDLAYAGEAAQVFLSNLPFFGFGFEVNPHARPADGMLEAIVLRAASRTEALRLLRAAYRGRHLENGRATVRRAREAVLAGPLPLACDSTPLGVGSASVTVEPGKLRIAAPWRR